jgi:N-acetylmuramoyl-L-alanine amidase
MTTADIKAELTDRQAVALTIFGEARAEDVTGQVAVGCVIRNRLSKPLRFGGRPDASWRDICLRKWQFSCWFEGGGASNFAAVMAAAEGLVNGIPPKPDSALAHALWVADGVMVHRTRDVTRGANHYLTTALLRTKPPGWTLPPAQQVAVIGGHAFFIAA